MCIRALEEARAKGAPPPVAAVRSENPKTAFPFSLHMEELEVFPKKAVFLQAEASESILEAPSTFQRMPLFSDLSQFAPCFLLSCQHKPEDGSPDATCRELQGQELSKQRCAPLQRTKGSSRSEPSQAAARQEGGREKEQAERL